MNVSNVVCYADFWFFLVFWSSFFCVFCGGLCVKPRGGRVMVCVFPALTRAIAQKQLDFNLDGGPYPGSEMVGKNDETRTEP